MADYRRFVAYVYEYQKGKKGNNCGFVKVEVRGKVCSVELHLQCQGLLPDVECKVYGFVRNKELLEGIFLGSCLTEAGSAECRLETFAEQMGGSEKSLNEMGGMVFTTDQGGFFGTEWDDQRIRPEMFRVTDKKAISEVEKENEVPEDSGEVEETEKNTMAEEEKEVAQQEEQSKELHTQSVQEMDRSGHETDGAEDETEKMTQILKSTLPGTPCEVFADGELTDCRKISPQDLHLVGRRACMLRNNRFVQYGSCNFGHLLLCRNKSGQLILGVPGGYDQQEHFMANMFGFPYFKESHNIQIRGGKGGYWYRLIDPANSNNRNGRT